MEPSKLLSPLELLRLLLPGDPLKGEPPLPRFLLSREKQEAQKTPEVQKAGETRPFSKPGCLAADESGMVLYHLMGLAAGWGGFGVLRQDVARLERAAQGAARMGDEETAARLRLFEERLPNIRTQEAAAIAAKDLEAIVQEAWELGVRCGRSRGLEALKDGYQTLEKVP